MQQQISPPPDATFDPTAHRRNYTRGGQFVFAAFSASILLLLALPEFVLGMVVGVTLLKLVALVSDIIYAE